MNRRHVLMAAAALALLGRSAWSAQRPIYIGDMHVHLFFRGAKPASTQPLGANMASGQATLVAWSLVADLEC
jgi:hypothetical protein